MRWAPCGSPPALGPPLTSLLERRVAAAIYDSDGHLLGRYPAPVVACRPARHPAMRTRGPDHSHNERWHLRIGLGPVVGKPVNSDHGRLQIPRGSWNSATACR